MLHVANVFARSLTICAVAVFDPTDLVIVLSVEHGGVKERAVNSRNFGTTTNREGDALRGPASDVLVEGRRVGESAGEGLDGGGVPTTPSAKL